MKVDAINQILLDCLSRDETRLSIPVLKNLSSDDWEALLEQAKLQRVRPLLYHRLRQRRLDTAIPAEVSDGLSQQYKANSLRNLCFNGELHQFVKRLRNEDIPVIVLKGMHMANAVYENIALREMGDLDLLIPAKHLAKSAGILADMGYESKNPFTVKAVLATNKHLPPFAKSDVAIFEIHWNVTKPSEPGHINADVLWENARPIQVAGVSALALSPEDLLLHLCHHASYGHQFEFGLRPACDIAELVHFYKEQLNWDTIYERARL